MTVKEHLDLFYDIKSFPEELKEETVSQTIKLMDLEKYTDVQSGELSGGNKRKLNVCIAILGLPPVVYLDEPSTGMDPKTRRFMWKIIEKMS